MNVVFRALVSTLLCHAVCAAAFAQGFTPEEAVKRMTVADGFSVKLFASEPDVRQPVSMTFDERGRLWVIQYLQYPHPAGLKALKVDRYLRTVYDKLPEPPPNGPRGVDRITILEDTDGDGRADKFKDFVNDLNLTTGLALGHGGVFVLQSPYLLFYPDRNGDDIPDGDPEVCLTGFGMEDSHAFANSLTWGPDGWLYGAQGSTVTANIRGITFQQGIWRYHPLTKEFELFAEGGGNTWGADFDQHGNMLAGTNYGNHAMLHQVQGGYYVKSFGKHGPLQNPHAYGFFNHVPHSNFKGGHVTIGGVVYQADSFPERFQNQYIAANVLSNAIYWHTIERDRSTLKNDFGGDLLLANDTWFRPIDCAVAPDGSVFIADWYDERANHVDPRDDWDKTNGRIYQLVADGTQPVKPFDLAKLSSLELVELLHHKNDWYGREARRILAARRDPAVIPPLKKIVLESDDDDLALRAFWMLYVSGGFNDALAEKLLEHRSEDIRTWVIRLLGDTKQVSPALHSRLLSLASTDASPTVRSQLACTAKRLPGEQALPIVREMLKQNADLDDPHIPLLLWWAVEDKAAVDRDLVLDLLAEPEAWKQPLVRTMIVERLAQRYAAAGEEADFESCARLLAMAPGAEETAMLIRGMEKGLQGSRRDTVPQALQQPLAKLWEQGTPDPTLIRFAIRLGSKKARDEALKQVVDNTTDVKTRLLLLQVLGQVGREEDAAQLLALLNDQTPAAVRGGVLQALQRFQSPEIPRTVLQRYPAMSAALKSQARGLLCSRVAWAGELLQAVDTGKIPANEVPNDQLQQIAFHKDEALNELIEKHWGRVVGGESPGDKAAKVHGIAVSVKLKAGDPLKGKELVVKTCLVCHTLHGEGKAIGPKLTDFDRKNTRFMLMNIVDPSAMIRKEYFMYTVITIDGRSVSGLIADSTPTTITIVDAKDQRTVIARDEIDEMVQQEVSLMPEKLLDAFTAQQVRDIVAYLQSDPPQPAKQDTSGE